MPNGTYTRPNVNSYPQLLTMRDLIDRLIDFGGGSLTAVNLQKYRSAIDEAYRQLVNHHEWKYYVGPYNFTFSAPYSTGTIEYDHTGGSSERLVTLSGSGAAFPSWAAYGHIRIDDAFYQVNERLGNTTLTLRRETNPGADAAAGTSYTLYRSVYTLPADFKKLYAPENDANNWWVQNYVSPEVWYANERHINQSGTPYEWTLLPDPHFYNAMAVVVRPYPNAATGYGMVYTRYPRPLVISGYNDATDFPGTVAVAGTTTVTGTSTAFSSKMIGSVLRTGDTAAPTQGPSGLTGLSPYVDQKIIVAVASATSLTVDSAFDSTYSGRKYCISDPVDVPTYLLDALLAKIRLRHAISNPGLRDVRTLEIDDQKQFIKACEADQLNLSGREDRWYYRPMYGGSLYLP